MGQLPSANAHAPELGAAVQGRDVLAGIEQAPGIEGALHAPEPLDLRSGELHAHLVDLLDANDPGQLHRTEAFANEVLEKCIAVGGTITGEHGVGVEKINQMCVQFRPDELELFHAVKAAFDARGLLNPGKAVPTLARCAEHGRMHVRGGRLPHPELPRF